VKRFFKCALLFLCLQAASFAADRDLHDYWDARCASCHGHAGQFARKFLSVENDKLVGVHHRTDLDLFLRTHYLTAELYAPTIAMLKAQAESGAIFRERCSGCHGTAAEFARKSLELKNDVLYGKKSQVPVRTFLKDHFTPPPETTQALVETLTRVLGEVRTSPP
jgi:hypothetical protein